MEEQPIQEISPAQRMYQNHLKNVAKYQKANPEKMREKNKRYLENMKKNNPDKYEDFLMKKAEYYEKRKLAKSQEKKTLIL